MSDIKYSERGREILDLLGTANEELLDARGDLDMLEAERAEPGHLKRLEVTQAMVETAFHKHCSLAMDALGKARTAIKTVAK